MKRDYKLYLNDIRESIRYIEEYTAGVTEYDFKNDKKLQDAVIRRLEIIGEASRNIPLSLKKKNKEVPWFEMAQFRDFIAHSYFEASIDRIWKTLRKRVPELKELLRKIKPV